MLEGNNAKCCGIKNGRKKVKKINRYLVSTDIFFSKLKKIKIKKKINQPFRVCHLAKTTY